MKSGGGIAEGIPYPRVRLISCDWVAEFGRLLVGPNVWVAGAARQGILPRALGHGRMRPITENRQLQAAVAERHFRNFLSIQ
jgi:hypothetical protein